jgi:ubiquitin-protein ligase
MENNSSQLESSSQHIRDFKVAIEFKYLMKNSPPGVYLLPEFDDMRHLHGVIFIRRGLYRDGIFRFKMTLPPGYNDVNTHPEIVFTPPVFNPLIDPITGALNFTADESLKTWNPERHYIVTALTYLKKVFYKKEYADLPISNVAAIQLLQSDKEEYYNKIRQSVEESMNRVYDELPSNSLCPMVFTEPKPAHDEILSKIKGLNDENVSSQMSA